MYYDFVQYSATQTSLKVFTLTNVTGFASIPEDAKAVLFLFDNNGNQATVAAKRTGSTLNVMYVYSSSYNDAMPNFIGEVTIHSSVGAHVLRNNNLGKAGILYYFQSNTLGYHQNSYDAQKDWVDPRITQFKNHDGFTGVLAGAAQLEFDDINIKTNSVGYHLGFANTLLANEGFSGICQLPAADGGSSYLNEWQEGKPELVSAMALVDAFMADDPNNHLIAIVGSGGESDSILENSTNFQDMHVATVKYIRDNLVGNARQSDFSKVPYICTGMSAEWMTLYPSVHTDTVQAVLENTPNIIPYSAFVSTVGVETLNEGGAFNYIHFTGDGCREIGNNRLYPAWELARGNDLNLNITDISITVNEEDETVSLALDTGMGSTDVSITVNEEDEIVSLALTAEESSVSSILNLTTGLGITSGGNGIGVWADQSPSGFDAVQTIEASKPTLTNGAAVFNATNADHLVIDPAILNNPDGHTIILKIDVTLSGAGSLNMLSNRDAFYINALTGCIGAFTNKDAATTVEGSTLVNTGTHVVAITVSDQSVISLYVDGVLDAVSTHEPFTKDITNIAAYLGGYASNGGTILNTFNGTIYSVRGYAGVLPVADIISEGGVL